MAAATTMKRVETPIHEMFKALATWKLSRSFEHTPCIRMLDLCTITGRHGFIVGAKGIAKSQLVRDTARCLEGASYHEDLMHAEKPIKDLLGVYQDIGELSKTHQFKYTACPGSPVHEANPDNPLDHVCPDWGIRYLDETFNGALTALNGLNSLLNETFVRVGPQVFHTNRITFGTGNAIKNFADAASNDTKLQTGGALWDRFLLREKPRPFMRAESSRAAAHEMPVDLIRSNTPPLQIPRALLEATRLKARMMVTGEKYGGTASKSYPMAIRRKVDRIVDAARKNGIPLSDRRWPWAREILAANAILCGRDIITEQDLKTARWWAWESPEQISIILEILKDMIAMAHPKVVEEETACGKAYQDLLDRAKADKTYFSDQTKAQARIATGNTTSAKLSDSIRELNALVTKFPDEADEILATVDQIKGWNRDILKRFVGVQGLED